MVPVRSDKASVLVGDIVRRPSRRWLLPPRPRRLAIWVILVRDCGLEDEEAEVKAEGWKESLRRIRWWVIWYRWRKYSVF